MDRYAVVVDPYSGARGFASAFRDRGCETVAVLSDPRPLASYSATWWPEDFHAVHYHDGDLPALLRTLAGYDPICVIPGNEHAVELAAVLVDALLPGTGNRPGFALAQRHKGHMAAALERAGLPRLATICSSDVAEVAGWIDRAGLRGRDLVIKPPKSGGTEDVHLVPAGADWREPFQRVLGGVNQFGLRNDEVIVQEYARGTEYIVDMYSVDGRHGLVDVCRYLKHDRDGRIGIYDAAIFIGPDDPAVPALAECAKRAADAVGIRNGAVHAEVMMTAEGPRLIEIAARLSGGCMMTAGRLATGDCQIDRAVRHHLDGAFSPTFELVQAARTVWLGTETPGILHNIDIMHAARDLPSFHSMSLVANGGAVAATVDAFTELGWIIQAHPDSGVVEADYRRIKDLQRQIRVEPAARPAPKD